MAITFGNPYTDNRLRNLYFNAPAPPAALSAPKRTLGEFVRDKATSVAAPVVGKLMARKLADLVDYSPVGAVTQGFDAGAQVRRGDLLGGGLNALLNVIPVVGPEAKAVKAFHGGRAFEGAFDLGRSGSGLAPAEERAIWFSQNPREANRYAWNVEPSQTYNGKAVYPANIDTTGFHSVDVNGPYDASAFLAALEEARRKRKSGVVFNGVSEHVAEPPIDQIAVIDPSRIR